MTQAPRPAVSTSGADPILDDLIEAFARRLEGGERVDPEAFAGEHPERGAELRRILPAMLALADLGGSAGAEPAEGLPVGGPGDAVTGTLGDFRVLREVGRGGMGVVYEAEQISLGRRVALKVLPFAAALDARQLQRFKNEAQAAAHLQHTNIVPVYYVGCERGVHFYAMQFIEGQTLAAVIHELRQLAEAKPGEAVRASPGQTGPWVPAAGSVAPSTTAAVAGLSTERSTRSPSFFRTVAHLGVHAAEALEHAHQLGVIHRDVKPANLLVDGGGRLWVTDFGLAHLQSQPGLTMTGDLLGTLRYMSPEQALAQRVAVDARTDVYSLGVTLYELLTLEPAYNGKSREEVLRQIAFEEPRLPRRLNTAIPAELEVIVLKAMAKNPEERYATAELADDLRRFLEDKPIRARRPSLRQRAVKWARRHKTVVRAALVILALAVAALAVSTVLVWRANEGLRQALERERVLHERERQNAYFQRIALAEREWFANNLSRMQQLLEGCPEDLRGWEWHYLRRLRQKGLPPLPHASAVLCAAFSPDGRRIASSDQGGVVKVWDAWTGKELLSFQAHANHARRVAFSPDGQRLASASWDGTAKVWDAQTGRLIHTLKVRGGAGNAQLVAFSPDGQYLACGGGQLGKFGEVTVWDATTGEELLVLGGHTLMVTGLAFSPDGRIVASGGDGIVKVWEVDWAARTARETLSFRAHRLPGVHLAFSPDGRRLASASTDHRTRADGEVKVWDVRTGAEVLALRGHVAGVDCVAFSPDGRRLASTGTDQTVKLWDVASGQEVLTLRGHRNSVRTVAFSPDGTRLVTASHDRTVQVWDGRPSGGEAGGEVRTLRGHQGGVRSVALHPGGRYLASAGDDALVKVWDLHCGRELRTLPGRVGLVVRLEFSNRGERLGFWGGGLLRVWDTTTWQERLTLTGGDELYLSSGGDDLKAVKEAAAGRKSRGFRGGDWVTEGRAWHPDGRRLATGNANGSVQLWDVTTGARIPAPPLRHAGVATSVAFSPGGGRLASGGLDRTVRVWDTATWRELRTLHDPTGGVWSVAWSPDGRRLAWGGQDATVKVGDPATGEILRTLRGHTSWVQSVLYSPDGRWIVSGSLDGTVKVWDAAGS
jgi:WD40 repeat protein/serine/threonine protein kinase